MQFVGQSVQIPRGQRERRTQLTESTRVSRCKANGYLNETKLTNHTVNEMQYSTRNQLLVWTGDELNLKYQSFCRMKANSETKYNNKCHRSR